MLHVNGPYITANTRKERDYGGYGTGDYRWMLKVGAECNRLLFLADRLAKSGKGWDWLFARDIRSIVARIEQCEELR